MGMKTGSAHVYAAVTSCFRRRKHTELHHQSERIHDKSGVLDFAVLHSVDDAPGFHGPPRGGPPRNSTRCVPAHEELSYLFS